MLLGFFLHVMKYVFLVSCHTRIINKKIYALNYEYLYIVIQLFIIPSLTRHRCLFLYRLIILLIKMTTVAFENSEISWPCSLRFWLLLIFDIPSIICSLFVLYHLLIKQTS